MKGLTTVTEGCSHIIFLIFLILSIGPIESIGLDGPIIILSASKSASVTSFDGDALSAP